MSDPQAATPSRAPFPTTQWSRVVLAGDPADELLARPGAGGRSGVAGVAGVAAGSLTALRSSSGNNRTNSAHVSATDTPIVRA